MKIFFGKTLFFTAILLLFPLALFAQISKIGFVTEEQTIKPNTISEAITIQTQDSSGSSFQTPETIDLVFTSSSPAGEFLNSSGNPATKTMSINTANRTFYYRDSGEGEFTIKVEATGRTSGEKWETSQKITVSSEAATKTSGEVLSENTESNTESSLSSSQSATSGSSPVNYSTPSSELQVSVGGDRLTSPGSPISFQATIKKNSSSNNGVTFSWSYGDGEVGSGALTTHSYKYPGEYALVLNAKAGNNFAVARLKVKVVEPELSLGHGDGYVEISNNSNYEINLFNWKIINSGKGFIFQPDTIVLPKSKIKVDDSLFAMKAEVEGKTILKDALGREVLSIAEPLKTETLEEASLKISQIQKDAIALIDLALSKRMVSEIVPKSVEAESNLKSPDNNAGEIVASEEVATSSLSQSNVLYEAPKQTNILSRAWQFLLGMLD